MLHIVCLPGCKAVNDISIILNKKSWTHHNTVCKHVHALLCFQKCVLAYIHAGAFLFFSEMQIIPGTVDAQNEKCRCVPFKI